MKLFKLSKILKEANTTEFPMSDIEEVQRKLHEAILEATSPEKFEDFFRSFDRDGNGYISADEFRNAVYDLGFDLTEQVYFTHFENNEESFNNY